MKQNWEKRFDDEFTTDAYNWFRIRPVASKKVKAFIADLLRERDLEIAEKLEKLSEKRYVDKNRKDVILWMYVRELINTLTHPGDGEKVNKKEKTDDVICSNCGFRYYPDSYAGVITDGNKCLKCGSNACRNVEDIIL